jgi:methionyl-tRNA synthetase
MATKKTFYVTTAIDYVNAEPHIGHAYQKIIADVLARFHKQKGEDVFFLTGTDEHGQKIAKSAEEKGKTPKEFVDNLSPKFENAWRALNVDFDKFIRTTDKEHEKKVQEFIKLMEKKGDIYKGEYCGAYCEGCEAYVTEKDLVNGRCPFHPNQELKEVKEEAYFFRLSKYEKKLLALYEKNKKYILPLFRRKEVINRVKEGLKDLNITRLKKNMSWGIKFPLDDNYVVYVWYEALLNYITGIGWPDGSKFKKFWPADIELLGIDNGWFHCVIWPAMLFSAGIEPAKTILINGFLTFNGQKISKSLGNSISPTELVKKYGADSIRYYVCRNFVFGQDGDFSEKELIARHNNELADKLGNLVSRVAGLIEKNGEEKTTNKLIKKLKEKEIEDKIDNYEFDKALNLIFEFIDNCNEFVQENKIWETHDKKKLYELKESILKIAELLWCFIPETSEKITKQFSEKKIKKGEILFTKI